MPISLNDLSPKMREQAIAKVAIEEARRRNRAAAIPPSAPPTEEKKPKGNKYGAKKVYGCLIDGTPHTFDSTKEFDRYNELAMMQRAGQISELQTQVTFELVPKQKKRDGTTERACSYIADFVYMKDGQKVVEDVKGYRNPSSAGFAKFVIKRKLMLWIYHIEVSEV